MEAWMVDVDYRHTDGKVTRVRKASPVNTRRGAEEFERQIRQALLDRTFEKEIDAKEKLTLEKFQERFLQHADTNNKISTSKSKRDILRKHLIPAFGDLGLGEITLSRLEEFKAQKLAEGLSKKSVNNILTCLRKLLNLANEWGELGAVPRIKPLNAPLPPFDFLTEDEARHLQASAETGRWQTMITVALHTGLRLGELAGLSWDDVDLTNGRLMVRQGVYRGHLDTPKGGRSREIPLNWTVRLALEAWPRRIGSKWIFPQENGQFIRNPHHTCAEAILRQAKVAGLRRIGWHVLRHTFASHLVMKGVPLKAVQELLGHSTIEMTMRYAHLTPAVKSDAVRLLDAPRLGNGTLAAHGEEAGA